MENFDDKQTEPEREPTLAEEILVHHLPISVTERNRTHRRRMVAVGLGIVLLASPISYVIGEIMTSVEQTSSDGEQFTPTTLVEVEEVQRYGACPTGEKLISDVRMTHDSLRSQQFGRAVYFLSENDSQVKHRELVVILPPKSPDVPAEFLESKVTVTGTIGVVEENCALVPHSITAETLSSSPTQ